MKKIKNKKYLNQNGFLAADFIFSFVLIISCGIIIFALTFSLAAIEVAQYITWSAARSYSAGNFTAGDSNKDGLTKFNKLLRAFPLLTGSGGSGTWFKLDTPVPGDNIHRAIIDVSPQNYARGSTENRHPWTGFTAQFELKLFGSIQIPFIGKITEDGSAFRFPITTFMYRNPSKAECESFFNRRCSEGISRAIGGGCGGYRPPEDNGC